MASSLACIQPGAGIGIGALLGRRRPELTYCGHSRPQPWRLCKITNGFRSQWAPRSTPISDPSSKPHGEDRSEPSTQSASPSEAAPSLAQLENANGDLSNYRTYT